ncbi:MAG: oxidoreductase [Propionibacteriaceae bacterium]|jgi:NAD(P)-dependent dehydrogenase (short-subunit alcohol dehydrogenase family)|nr:oxidoreductase [Propionibacteriaceae bacterium]
MSTTNGPKTALVTGASSGIGQATAVKLQTLGYIVYGAARRADRLQTLAASGVRPLPLDLTDDAQLTAGVERIIDQSGRLDVLVNSAGYGSYGAIEDVPLDEARRQFEVNLFGLARLIQLAAPQLRRQHSGTIINISSMGGRFAMPLGGWYHATKFALEGLSDALRMELRPFGVDVVVIEPGGISTEWAGITADHLDRVAAGSAYARQIAAVTALMRNQSAGQRQSSPSLIADTVARIVTARRPRTRYAVGFMAKPVIAARRLLPDRAFDRLISAALGIPRD